MIGRSPFPANPPAVGLGVGLDLPWGGTGFDREAARGGDLAPAALAYLIKMADAFTHLFVSWQPLDRGALKPEAYYPAFDRLFDALGARYPVRALHHTALNLGSLERYDRSPLLALTNALVARYDFQWVNEDLGLWSLNGKSLPYPLPPYFTEAGLKAAIANVALVQSRLRVPLLVEFPGFSDGMAVCVGRMHAFDFFNRLAVETDAAVTLDTGHLLSYQWLRGKRENELFEDLERLPLSRCFEIHLSGCEITNGRFHDRHHGVLLDAQISLLKRLLPVCPNLRAITYEDPVFDLSGELILAARPNFAKLQSVVREGPWPAAV